MYARRGLYTLTRKVYVCRERFIHTRDNFLCVPGERFILTSDNCLCMLEKGLY